MKYSMSVWVFVWYDHLIKEVSRIQTGISICYIPSLLAIQKCTFILYVKYRFIILKWFTNKDIFLNSILWIYFFVYGASFIYGNEVLWFPSYQWSWLTLACFFLHIYDMCGLPVLSSAFYFEYESRTMV